MPYVATFPKGARVRIADREFLTRFLETWTYHHKLSPDQLDHANAVTTVAEVSVYHGGDQLYSLEGIPGIWHEQCLRAIG